MRRNIILLGMLIALNLSGCGDKEAKMHGSTDVTEENSNFQAGDDQEETVSAESAEDRTVDLADYSSYLKKIWIEKGWISNDYGLGGSVSLVITKIQNGHIEGYIQNLGNISDDYFDFSVGEDFLYPFDGEIYDGVAECEYVEGRNKPLTIIFYENDYIRVKMDGDTYRSYLLRPYHVSDWQFRGEPITYEVELDSWGTVTLFYADLEDRHSYPWVLLLNEQGDILYKFPGRFRINSKVSKVVIEDVNGDGLKDVEVITCMNGTDEDRMEWFFYQMEDGLFYLEKCNGDGLTDISPFLTFDWTNQEVLFHPITPMDSARGWVFSLADVDFDGYLEVLITFTAMHAGENSLYIYKQDGEKVFSLADTYATFREDIIWRSEGYEELSPYLDIELLDAYVNEEGEYRYLSLDYNSFGGGPWNKGIGELLLYVTTFQKDTQPMKLAEIQFFENESFEGMEIFFQDEKVDEPEKLHELLKQYMAGYKKVEMEYETLEVSFSRDIVGWNENERRQCLEDLYEALKYELIYFDADDIPELMAGSKCDPDMPEVYRNVLWQYVRAIRADVDWDTFYERQMNGEWEDIYWVPFSGRTGEKEIYYCLKDLTDDGFPELIMGHDDPVGINFIYYYNQEKGIQCTHMSDYYDLTLYEGGVVRLEHGIYIMYEQFQPETKEWELVVRSEYSWNEDASRYYRGSWNDPVEIAEEEYQQIVNGLTREPLEPIELEWTLLSVTK